MKRKLKIIAFALTLASLVSLEGVKAAPAVNLNYNSSAIDDDGGAGDTPSPISFINIYPNPTTGGFYLTYRSEDRLETQLEIMNEEGKKIYSETLTSARGTNFMEIKDSLLPGKGIYFVRLAQGKVKSYAERIVKK